MDSPWSYIDRRRVVCDIQSNPLLLSNQVTSPNSLLLVLQQMNDPAHATAFSNRSTEHNQPPPGKPTLPLDPKMLRELGGSFRHFIRSPGMSYRWVYCEFFYSNMDRALFLSNNEFEECLNEHFPNLKTRKLRKTEWSFIRRSFGKPRRLSPHFLSTERASLAENFEQIRKIQKRQFSTDIVNGDLPDEIPLHYIIGTRVTAMVRGLGMSGLLCRGKIDGLDLKHNLYRISFDSELVGKKSVKDYDVLSDEPPHSISTANISMKIKENQKLKRQMLGKPTLDSDLPINGHLGGFRIRFLECIVRLRKLLRVKSMLLQHFKAFNAVAETTCISRSGYPKDFVIQYARCIVSLDCFNVQISHCLEAVDLEYEMMSTGKDIYLKVINPKKILRACDEDGGFLVTQLNLNRQDNTTRVQNQKLLHLITQLASLMYQLNALSQNSSVWNSCDVHSTKSLLNRIKDSLRGKNIGCFESTVELPVNRITAGIVHSNFQEFKRRVCNGFQ